MKKRETYPEARLRLFAHLSANGWTVRPLLKQPVATGRVDGLPAKLTFKSRAVYIGKHSTFLEIRGNDSAAFLTVIGDLAREMRSEVCS